MTDFFQIPQMMVTGTAMILVQSTMLTIKNNILKPPFYVDSYKSYHFLRFTQLYSIVRLNVKLLNYALHASVQ